MRLILNINKNFEFYQYISIFKKFLIDYNFIKLEQN